MRRPVVAAGIATSLMLTTLLATSPPAIAAPVLDQSTLGASVATGWVVVSSSQSVGGTFMAGQTGTLDTLEVTAQTFGSPTNLTASIYAVNGSGTPVGSALSSTAVNFSGLPANPAYATISATFTTPTSISQGSTYAWVLSSTDSSPNFFGVKYTFTTFANIALISNGSGPWATDTTVPPLFAIYVTSATPSGNGAGEPAVPLQQFTVPPHTRSEDCAARANAASLWDGLTGYTGQGWGLSYAQWPHGGSGGWVCSRQPVRQAGGWVFK
jgi:hypothetical protein